ncbi:hypothetical protein ACQPU1_12100 [Clostridium paraputrificum]|uniref:hypothetical protein n=1 Tax=Clostridium paraputrificum TaxID=29363 RepID=UPI003D33967F
MKDEKGKDVGVLAHLVKTHVSEANGEAMISALTKDLDNIKIADQSSNEEILSYTNPKVQTNKLNTLSDAVNVSSGNEKL